MFYGLTIEDFSDPKNPKVLGSYDMEDGAIGAAAGDDNFIYVLSDNTYALHVLRYSPSSLSPVPLKSSIRLVLEGLFPAFLTGKGAIERRYR